MRTSGRGRAPAYSGCRHGEAAAESRRSAPSPAAGDRGRCRHRKKFRQVSGQRGIGLPGQPLRDGHIGLRDTFRDEQPAVGCQPRLHGLAKRKGACACFVFRAIIFHLFVVLYYSTILAPQFDTRPAYILQPIPGRAKCARIRCATAARRPHRRPGRRSKAPTRQCSSPGRLRRAPLPSAHRNPE